MAKPTQYPGVFITSPFRMFPDFGTSDLVFRKMVVVLRRMAFLNKIISTRGVDVCPLCLKVVKGPPFFISFLGLHILNYKCTTFTKIRVQALFGCNDLKNILRIMLRLRFC